MQNLLTTLLTSGLLFSLLASPQLKAQELSTENLSLKLQKVLNKRDTSAFSNFPFLINENSSIKFKYQQLIKRFSDANWNIKPSNTTQDGRQILDITITGTQKLNGSKYYLESKQKIALIASEGVIKNTELLSEYSILRSSNVYLPITLNIPDIVLTGSKYDIDIILDQPINNAMVAGGLIGLSAAQVKAEANPNIEIAPMGSGGLFKSVQAPLEPGSQTWAAILAHPDGLISVTKYVKVISNSDSIKP